MEYYKAIKNEKEWNNRNILCNMKWIKKKSNFYVHYDHIDVKYVRLLHKYRTYFVTILWYKVILS